MLVYDRRAMKQPSRSPVTSGGVDHVINSQPNRFFRALYTNLVTSQGHGFCVHVWTLLRVKNGLRVIPKC